MRLPPWTGNLGIKRLYLLIPLGGFRSLRRPESGHSFCVQKTFSDAAGAPMPGQGNIAYPFLGALLVGWEVKARPSLLWQAPAVHSGLSQHKVLAVLAVFGCSTDFWHMLYAPGCGRCLPGVTLTTGTRRSVASYLLGFVPEVGHSLYIV